MKRCLTLGPFFSLLSLSVLRYSVSVFFSCYFTLYPSFLWLYLFFSPLRIKHNGESTVVFDELTSWAPTFYLQLLLWHFHLDVHGHLKLNTTKQNSWFFSISPILFFPQLSSSEEMWPPTHAQLSLLLYSCPTSKSSTVLLAPPPEYIMYPIANVITQVQATIVSCLVS